MPDIKLDQPNEKAAALSEQPAVDDSQLKKSLESLAEKMEKRKFEAVEKQAVAESAATETVNPTAVSSVVDIMAPTVKRQKQVENILAQGLEEIYLNLAPQKQQEFKKMGEETAGKIGRLLAKTKINIGEIIKLIKKWLALIPGINKYFLEQEDKLKADEIVKMKDNVNF